MKRTILIAILVSVVCTSFAQVDITKARIIKDNGGTKTIGYTITGNVKVLRGEFYFYEGRKPNPDSVTTNEDLQVYLKKVTINRSTSTPKEDTVVADIIKTDNFRNSHDPELRKVVKNNFYFYGKIYYKSPSGTTMSHKFKIKVQKYDQLTKNKVL